MNKNNTGIFGRTEFMVVTAVGAIIVAFAKIAFDLSAQLAILGAMISVFSGILKVLALYKNIGD
jgi:hypothetical protein